MRAVTKFVFLLLLFVLAGGTQARAQDLAGRLGGGPRDLVDDPSLSGALAAPPLPAGWITVHRGPLAISYPPAIEPLVRLTLARAPQDARTLAAQFGLADLPDLAVRLVPDPAVMRQLSPAAAPPPAYAVGVAYPSLRLALVSASAPRTWEASDLPRVLRHELSHLVLAEATGHVPLPRWFAEGIAVEQSDEHSFERFEALATASFTRGILPLRRLDGAFSDSPEQVNVAYAQSADFVSYLLRTDGTPRFAVLLAHVRAGLSLEDAIQETYGASLAHIEEEWRRDMQSRFMLAPLWAGTGLAWMAGVGLLLAATVRRRKRSRQTLARWDREEKARIGRSRLTVVTPGLNVMRDARRREPAEDDELPRVALDGERHTLH